MTGQPTSIRVYVVLMLLFVLQLLYVVHTHIWPTSNSVGSLAMLGIEHTSTTNNPALRIKKGTTLEAISPKDVYEWLLMNPLSVPPGSPPNLPSIPADESLVDSVRHDYGGKGDKKHLGGFTELDLNGISPALWTNMILEYGVHSFIDVGCGRGTSSLWFKEHGADVLCVEGSRDAIFKSFLPSNLIVEHDYSRGPWWPKKTYDAAWSVEFLEHVSRQHQYNYISTLRKAALIFVTSSRWGKLQGREGDDVATRPYLLLMLLCFVPGGWHHVEIHPDSWWIQKFESYGFRYSANLTEQSKHWAEMDYQNQTVLAPNGKEFDPQHLATSLKVFVNPAVASLPQHQHLFPRHGCFLDYQDTGFRSKTRLCGIPGHPEAHLETPLPDSFFPLSVTPEMHQRWNELVQNGLSQPKTS